MEELGRNEDDFDPDLARDMHGEMVGRERGEIAALDAMFDSLERGSGGQDDTEAV